MMKIIVLALLALVTLSACPSLPKPDGCPPWAMRCGPNGEPQVCSGTQRWTPADRPCADNGAVCCRTIGANGKEQSACVPQASCLPDLPPAEVADAGAE